MTHSVLYWFYERKRPTDLNASAADDSIDSERTLCNVCVCVCAFYFRLTHFLRTTHTHARARTLTGRYMKSESIRPNFATKAEISYARFSLALCSAPGNNGTVLNSSLHSHNTHIIRSRFFLCLFFFSLVLVFCCTTTAHTSWFPKSWFDFYSFWLLQTSTRSKIAYPLYDVRTTFMSIK